MISMLVLVLVLILVMEYIEVLANFYLSCPVVDTSNAYWSFQEKQVISTK